MGHGERENLEAYFIPLAAMINTRGLYSRIIIGSFPLTSRNLGIAEMIGAGECPIARVDFAGIAEISNTRDGEMISTHEYNDCDKLSASVLSLPPRTHIHFAVWGSYPQAKTGDSAPSSLNLDSVSTGLLARMTSR